MSVEQDGSRVTWFQLFPGIADRSLDPARQHAAALHVVVAMFGRLPSLS